MITRSGHRKFFATGAVLAVSFGLVFQVSAQSDNSAMIILKDGRATEGQIVSVGDDGVEYRLSGVPTVQKMPYTQIDYIEFPQPDAWVQTMEAFKRGEYEKVVGVFKQVSNQKGASTGYPAPGNFATRAERRLIDCYRRLRDPVQIGYLFKKLDWSKLPPGDRDMMEIITCWALVGDGNWDGARQAIAEASKVLADTDPASAELNFLLALIAEGSLPDGEGGTEDEMKAVAKAEEEAVVQFGRAFGIDAAADPGMAAAALKESIENLVGMEDREDELKALVHLYARLHGRGQLWAEADEYLKQVHATKLEIYAAPSRKAPEKAEPEEVKARYVRIERTADGPSFVTLAEVQVMSGRNNIGPTGSATQSSLGKIGKKKFPPNLAIDGKTVPGYQVGSFSRTNMEKEPWWELDLGTMKPIEEIVLFNCKNKQGEFIKPPGDFRIVLLDGARQEVFQKKGEPSPEPKVSIKIGGGGSGTDTPPAPPTDGAEPGEPAPAGEAAPPAAPADQ